MRAILAGVLTAAVGAGAAGLTAHPAHADGGMTVQLPDVSGLPEEEAKALLSQLAQVNVITSNCPGYPISDAEWTLVTGTSDRLAARLGLDPQAFDSTYYGPAFKLLDDPDACDRVGPTAGQLIDRLVALGGGTTPINQSQ
ncbi:hypothetical protein [uncultured Paracoccus sp.]|uniref:hypothetical protein n=1 Tax=uncultured Paracoccus sp. TaxID=189685 RepID=UPI00262633AA|nr:hypothetical protein [uncultured Paracoccus sp.]